jgi:hypothetical protein
MHVSSRPPSRTIQNCSLHENLHDLVLPLRMMKRNMRLKGSWIIRIHVVNESTWYIGWDIPQLMINGSMRTTSMLPKPCNSTLIRSNRILRNVFPRILIHVLRHSRRNVILRILRHVIRSRIMTPRRKTTPQGRNLRREGCKVTRQRASRAL